MSPFDTRVMRFFRRCIFVGFGFAWLNPMPSHAQEAKTLQAQLQEQEAKNESLRTRIAKLEEVLKSDVCKNPEAEKLLHQESEKPVAGDQPSAKK